VFAILHAPGLFAANRLKSRCRLQAENLFLRHQPNIALRQALPRFQLCGSDRALLILIKPIWPSLLELTQAVAPLWLQKLSGAENLKADAMTGRDSLHLDPSDHVEISFAQAPGHGGAHAALRPTSLIFMNYSKQRATSD